MFVVTALGHQGWLLGTARTHVLIDPILEAGFARLPLSAPTVFPPRRIDLAAFPPIDAVLISHEHPDHLDFASLQRVDRGVPIYLSAHASDAARRVIASLGFRVEALTPGVPCGIGELGVLPLPPYVIGEPGENEVDVVPLLVRDHEGHGNFFTSVDIHQTREMAAEVRRHVDRPGVWTYANNAMDSSHHYEWMARPTDPVAEQARSVHENYVGLFQGWEQPEVFLINGNGVRLGRDLEPLNRHLFHLDGEALAAEMESRLPGHAFRAVRPGTTVTMVDGEVVEVREGQPFLGTAERDLWPARGGEPVADGARLDFEPGTGRKALTDAERDELERALAEFGRFLFARASYRGIYKLMAGRDHPPSMQPTLALALREGPEGRAQVWEFRPRACAFVRVACESPRDRYVAGGEFWASDVLASLTCRALADDLFHLGRKRLWNAAPKVFRCDLDTELQLYSHALRLPGPVEALYRGCLAPESRVALRAPTEAERAPPHDHTQPPPRRAHEAPPDAGGRPRPRARGGARRRHRRGAGRGRRARVGRRVGARRGAPEGGGAVRDARAAGRRDRAPGRAPRRRTALLPRRRRALVRVRARRRLRAPARGARPGHRRRRRRPGRVAARARVRARGSGRVATSRGARGGSPSPAPPRGPSSASRGG